MRGVFEYARNLPTMQPQEIEWCERRILQRIHRLTLGTLRKQVEPVNAAGLHAVAARLAPRCTCKRSWLR